MEFKTKSCEITEVELLVDLKAGKVPSYEVLFYKYYTTVYAFINGMLKDSYTAEDIAQNIFLKVWIHRQELNETLSIKNYLFVLAKHEVYNHFRNKHTSLMTLKSSLSECDTTDKESPMPDADCNMNQLNDMINKTIDEMPPMRQQIFRMSRLENIPSKDIAQKLGLSVRTVDKHIELAIKDVRQKLGPFIFFVATIFIL